MVDIKDHNTPDQTKAKAAATRTIKREHARQEAIARAEHRLYVKHATKDAAIQARTEAEARKAAERKKEMGH